MTAVVWMVVCALFGSAIGMLVGRELTRPARRRRPLPPATARRIERAARANRLELPADKPAVHARLENLFTFDDFNEETTKP